MKSIVVLISGSGSNLQAIIDACAAGFIAGRIKEHFVDHCAGGDGELLVLGYRRQNRCCGDRARKPRDMLAASTAGSPRHGQP